MIFPSENRGKGKKCNADGDKPSAERAKNGFECGDGQGRTCIETACGRIDLTQHAGACNAKTGDRADNDCIPECTGHIDIGLADRMIGCCGSSSDGSRTHTGFVGETSAGNTILHGRHH